MQTFAFSFLFQPAGPFFTTAEGKNYFTREIATKIVPVVAVKIIIMRLTATVDKRYNVQSCRISTK